MPAPLLIIAAWVGHHLASDVDSKAWDQLKSLWNGEPDVNAIARAMHDSIATTADAVATDNEEDLLRQGMINAFEDHYIDYGSSDDDSVLGGLRHSIESTLRESGLASMVPAGTMTQLEHLAPGVSMDRLVALVTFGFVANIKSLSAQTGSPLANLSQQLNADETHEQLEIIEDLARGGLAKVDALTELMSGLLATPVANIAFTAPNGFATRIRAMFDAMTRIHSDYLTSFAEAEKLIREGVGSTDLLSFLETRRAALVADRLVEISHADQFLDNHGDAHEDKVRMFAQEVSDYFKASNVPARITYFTGLLTYTRSLLLIAEEKQREGPVNIGGFFLTTADHGQGLLSALASARVDIDFHFKRVVSAFTALEKANFASGSESSSPAANG